MSAVLTEGKPRLSYAAFVAQQQKGITVAAVIRRFVAEMDGTAGSPPVRPLGVSHRMTLLRIAVEQLGPIVASALTKQDVIAYCRARTDICAATRNQYVTYLAGALRYAGSAWDDCAEVSDAAIAGAKPFLTRNGLISTSRKRSRRPTQEELEKLFDLFVEQNRRPKNKIDMVLIALWQIASGRRIGETCALLWGDWDRQKQTILVRKMKDPRNRSKSKVVALTAEAQRMLEALEHARLTPDDPSERIFKFNSHSVSARYTEAKKILGIVDLRLHDSRRECASRLLEKGYTPRQVILVTGHEKEDGAANIYMHMNPATFKDGPLGARPS